MSRCIVGVDESGKGDYFGPLVVAAAAISDDALELLRELNVRDSKKLSDRRAHELANRLKAQVPHNVVVIMPPKYNQLYEKIRNLNRLLAWGHARAIENLLAKSPVERVIIDQFADARLIEGALMELGRRVVVTQRVRGEEELPVAAASILARVTFVEMLGKLSRQWQAELPKGAGASVDRAGASFVAAHGQDKLAAVAKLHFKNTQKVNDLLGQRN